MCQQQDEYVGLYVCFITFGRSPFGVVENSSAFLLINEYSSKFLRFINQITPRCNG